MKNEIMIPTPELSLTDWKRKLCVIVEGNTLVDLCPDEDSFNEKFHPTKQVAFVGNERKCLLGGYPTLGQINAIYNEPAAQQWLIRQVCETIRYLGYKQQPTSDQIDQLAEHIYLEFRWLKVSEIMLFLWMYKDQRFGLHYGTTEPSSIMMSLREYVYGYRKDRIEALMDEMEEQYENWHRQNIVRDRDFLKVLAKFHEEQSPKIVTNMDKAIENDQIMESALALTNNIYGYDEDLLNKMCAGWAAKYHCTPQEYVTKNRKEE